MKPTSLFRIVTISHALRGSRSMSNVINDRPSAGIIVIGDEILKGQTKETNSHFLCKRLFCLGVRVHRISIIPDDLETIAKEVLDFSKSFNYVITSGGIGPTHDDRTYEGVAQAFNESLVYNQELVDLCKQYFKTDNVVSPKFKLAQIPESSRLHYGFNKTTNEKMKIPLVNVKNVYIFPGIPSLLERAFLCLEDLFRNPNYHCHMREVYINDVESNIVEVLNEVDESFKHTVLLGSYPELHNSYYKVKLILESESLKDIDQACDILHTKLPQGSIVKYEPDPVSTAVKNVYELMDDPTFPIREKLAYALKVIEMGLDKYSLQQICVGFNGGKDCTALLHLVYAAICRKYGAESVTLTTLYIRSKLPFPEVEQFIQESTIRYKLKLLRYDGRMKEQLKTMKQENPSIKGVFMGTRRTDPYSDSLDDFAMTDSDWPSFMRINPLLDWTYHDVWIFLRSLCLPYCSLYDCGYTSLGSTEDTHPNPLLEYVDKRGIVIYKAAWTLEDGEAERHGRL